VEYSSFSVGPESDFYRLDVAGYSGDAGDALASPVKNSRKVNGKQFSTPDVDNDNNVLQCWGGITGWWLKNCARSTLNMDLNGDWNADTDDMIQDVAFARMLVKLR